MVAKEVRSRHPQQPRYIAACFSQRWEDALATSRLIAHAGPLWPAARPPDGRRLQIARQPCSGCANLPGPALRARAAQRHQATHQWASCRGIVRCLRCGEVRSRLGATAQRDCTGLPRVRDAVLTRAPNLGHELWRAEVARRGEQANSVVLFCIRCGAYTETGRSRVLCDVLCSGRPSRHGEAQLRRIRRGRHPRAGGRGTAASVLSVQPIRPSTPFLN